MKGEAKTTPNLLSMKSWYSEIHRRTLFWSTFFFWETTAEEEIVISKYDLKKKLEKLMLRLSLGKMEEGEKRLVKKQ